MVPCCREQEQRQGDWAAATVRDPPPPHVLTVPRQDEGSAVPWHSRGLSCRRWLSPWSQAWGWGGGVCVMHPTEQRAAAVFTFRRKSASPLVSHESCPHPLLLRVPPPPQPLHLVEIPFNRELMSSSRSRRGASAWGQGTTHAHPARTPGRCPMPPTHCPPTWSSVRRGCTGWYQHLHPRAKSSPLPRAQVWR